MESPLSAIAGHVALPTEANEGTLGTPPPIESTVYARLLKATVGLAEGWATNLLCSNCLFTLSIVFLAY